MKLLVGQGTVLGPFGRHGHRGHVGRDEIWLAAQKSCCFQRHVKPGRDAAVDTVIHPGRRPNRQKATGGLCDVDNVAWRDSPVDEYTPIPFLQVRGGARRYEGPALFPLQNRGLYFVELHGFF